MADPFSLGASILGVVGLTIQIGEILVKFSLNWAHAPDDVKQFNAEIQTLKTTLSTTYANAITNPEFEKAMRGKESALLKHFKQQNESNKSGKLDLSVATCTSRLQKLLAELQKAARSGNSAFSWNRLKMAFLASNIREAVEDLHRQCQVLNNLIGIDSLTLAVETLKEVRAARQEAEDDRRARQDWESKNDDALARIEDSIDDQVKMDGLERLSHVLNLISPNDYASQQRDYLSKKTEGTGCWLLQSEEYLRWVRGTGGTLFCHGMPGSGKTIMSSIVIDDLYKRIGSSRCVYLAYVYCNFRLKHEQSSGSVISSLLRQLVQQTRGVPDYIDNLYAKDKILPTLSQITSTLELCTKGFSKGYIIIDALDEFSTSFHAIKKLVGQLNEIQRKTGLNLMVTTRQIYQAEDLFHTDCIKLEVRASDSDVGKYVQSRLSDLPRYVQKDSCLQARIRSAVINHVQGMFLLAELHLESLMDKKSPKAMRRALEELDSGDDAYKIAYEKAMHRISGQTDDQRQLATQVLSWITFAKRPLTIQELQHALAVDIYDYQSDCFESDNITDIDFIRSVCAGLVTVDKIVGVIRLVHHTAQQYFDQTRAEHFPRGDWQIATTCHQYLCYRNVSPEPLLSRDEYRKRLQQWPLYGYASEYWHEHIDMSKRHSDIGNFLKNAYACAGAYQTAVIAKYTQYEGSDYYFVSWDFAMGSACSMALHWAAFVGHEDIARELLQGGCDVNQEDFEGMTPLMVASRQGHGGLVRMLLCEWHAEATTSEQGKSPLLYATTFNQEKTVRVLLEHSHVGNAGSAPLGQAIALGYIGVVKLLLSDPRVNPYVALPDGKSGLTIAASSGFSGIVDLLLSKNDLEVEDRGRMALSLALQKGYTDIARRLIDDQRVYTSLDNAQGLAILSSVVHSGDVDLLSKLIQNLDIASNSSVDKGKITPLVLAVQTGHLHVVCSLLEYQNVDINAKDELGRTALSWAAGAGVGDILHTLLEVDGIDTEVRDNKGWPPLFHAAAGTCEENVSMLLTVGRVPVDTLGPFGTTSLFHVKETGIAQVLLDAGTDYNWRNAKGVTPLMHMYHEGHENHAVLELLCQRGADLNLLDENGSTILLRATKRGDVWMANLLLKHGADVNKPGKYGSSILFSALEQAPKAVLDDFVGVCARRDAVFAFDKGLVTDPKAKVMDYANRAHRYRAVIGLLLRWGAEKESLSQLDLLKLKSKKGAL